MAFTGDIIPHVSIKSPVTKNNKGDIKKYIKLFSHISEIFNNTDIVFGNMEGASASEKLRLNHYRAFNAPLEFVKALKISGFNVLTIANNHIFDCKYQGMKETIRNISKNSIQVCGYTKNKKHNIAIFKKNGIKIGIIGITQLLNYNPDEIGITNIAYYKNIEDSLNSIKKTKKEVDFLITSIHWGEEYKTDYTSLKKSADKILKAGSDCIIGHHPHILLPIEYKKTNHGYKNITAYSLGNLIANIGREYRSLISKPEKGSPRRTIILKLFIHKVNGSILVKKYKIIPVWIHNNYYSYNNKKEKQRNIYPVLMKNSVPEYLSNELPPKNWTGILNI